MEYGIFMNIYRVMLIAEYTMALVVFAVLFKYVATYGRYASSATRQRKTYFISNRVGWLLMELPAVFTILVVATYAALHGRLNTIGIVFISMWSIHYMYRTFIFPFLSANKTRAFTVSVVVSGFVFNIVNGFINGWALFFTPLLKTTSIRNVHVYIGIIVFFIGFTIHVISDKVLRDIKRIHKGNYGVPNTFLHKYIASPNYFGEIIQWFGFYLATYSPAALAFVFFTCSNLIPRAYKHRQWYRKNFPEYPHNRKIIVPFFV